MVRAPTWLLALAVTASCGGSSVRHEELEESTSCPDAAPALDSACAEPGTLCQYSTCPFSQAGPNLRRRCGGGSWRSEDVPCTAVMTDCPSLATPPLSGPCLVPSGVRCIVNPGDCQCAPTQSNDTFECVGGEWMQTGAVSCPPCGGSAGTASVGSPGACVGPEDCPPGQFCVASTPPGGITCQPDPVLTVGGCCFTCNAPPSCTLCRSVADCPTDSGCLPLPGLPAGLGGCVPIPLD